MGSVWFIGHQASAARRMGSVWSIAYNWSHEHLNATGLGSEHEHTLYYCGFASWKDEPCAWSDEDFFTIGVFFAGVLLVVCISVWACQPLEVAPKRTANYQEVVHRRTAQHVPVAPHTHEHRVPPPPSPVPTPTPRVLFDPSSGQRVVVVGNQAAPTHKDASLLHCDIGSLVRVRD